MSDPPAFRPHAVRGLIFDLDGTLVDSYAAITASLNHVRHGAGLAALEAAVVRRQVGHGLERLIAEFVAPDRVAWGVRRFREHYAAVCTTSTVALPRVRETLSELRERGLRLSVASNKPARFSRLILERLDLLGLLDDVQGPDVAGTTKPEPTMLRNCLSTMGLSPKHAAYVGDMVLDVETAARAGVPVILVAGGSSPDHALRETGQTLLRELGELRELLRDYRGDFS